MLDRPAYYAPMLCLVLAAAVSCGPVDTPCSHIQNAGGFTNATEIAMKLALLENEDVMRFVADSEQRNVESFNLYQCTYEYDSEPVVLATAICDASDLESCVVLATYNETQCRGATLCPDILNERPAFAVDCSGIAEAHSACALACSSNTSDVTGMETCTEVASADGDFSPTESPGGGGSGGGSYTNTSSGTKRPLKLGSLAALVVLLLRL